MVMSNRFKRNIERHTRLQERTLGDEVFSFGGSEYPCSVYMEDIGEVIDEHGNLVQYMGTIRVRTSVFGEDAEAPGKGDEVTVGGEVRKVAHFKRLLGSILWLYLTDSTT
jgi:hypothetical protein